MIGQVTPFEAETNPTSKDPQINKIDPIIRNNGEARKSALMSILKRRSEKDELQTIPNYRVHSVTRSRQECDQLHRQWNLFLEHPMHWAA